MDGRPGNLLPPLRRLPQRSLTARAHTGRATAEALRLRKSTQTQSHPGIAYEHCVSKRGASKGRWMLKIPLWTALVILAALLACGGQTPATGGAAATTSTETATSTPSLVTPAPEPTETPQAALTATPGPTAAPRATPASSPPPRPTETPAPPGVLAPLHALDSGATLTELSDAELACIGENPERQTRLVGCLEDKTLARLFLAGFVPGPEPLSESTSECVRAAFDVIDPRAVMTAGIEGDPGRAMAGSMAGFLVTPACLSDEEWEKAGPAAGASDQDRAGGQCLMAELGGPGNMAEAMLAAQEGDLTSMANAGGRVRAGHGTHAPDAAGTDGNEHRGNASSRTGYTHAHADGNDDDNDNDNDNEHPGHHSGRDTGRHPRVQQVRVETLDGRRRRLPGREAGSPHRRKPSSRYLQDRPEVPGRDRELVGHRTWDTTWGTRATSTSTTTSRSRTPTYRAGGRGTLRRKRSTPTISGKKTTWWRSRPGHNRSKGARGPEEWSPPDKALWCDYATDWAEIKQRWGLTMAPGESGTVMDMLGTCEDPARVVTETGEAVPVPTPVRYQGPVYGSCDDAKAARETLVQGSRGRGEGFPEDMVPSARDGDRDGIVCET